MTHTVLSTKHVHPSRYERSGEYVTYKRDTATSNLTSAFPNKQTNLPPYVYVVDISRIWNQRQRL